MLHMPHERPSAEGKLPASGHATQAACPSAGWYSPAGHASQKEDAAEGTLPGAHVVHAAAPSPDTLPDAQGRHAVQLPKLPP
jgi:hypothetical protein